MLRVESLEVRRLDHAGAHEVSRGDRRAGPQPGAAVHIVRLERGAPDQLARVPFRGALVHQHVQLLADETQQLLARHGALQLGQLQHAVAARHRDAATVG